MALRTGVVSGDGLPVSGLLTTLRTVRTLGIAEGALDDTPLPADLGWAWRPDKPGYYPHGQDAAPCLPPWLSPAHCTIPDEIGPAELARRLDAIRAGLCDPDDGGRPPARLLEPLTERWHRHFSAWLRTHALDLVIAVNMTLPDAAPATAGLHRALAGHFRGRPPGPGGVLFWDHDLFGSCAITDDRGRRYYPPEPVPATPVPQADGITRWAVVSEPLAEEAARYPTALAPMVVPNPLPSLPRVPDRVRLTGFARERGLDPARPILLNPARMFGVKGVHLAVRAHAVLVRLARQARLPVPYLLLFGSDSEDPGYAARVRAEVAGLGLTGDVRHLGGVPLTSHRRDGGWHLDEVDLLSLASGATGSPPGGVLFTPAVPDVETVGLGPALAAIAGLPCLTTPYRARRRVYPALDDVVWNPRRPGDLERAAARFHTAMLRPDPARLRANEAAVRAVFPDEPWRALWRRLAAEPAPGGTRRARSAAVAPV